ncbi:MAG: alpha-mannosidase, partial [Marinilabiliales bacterium]
DGPVYTSYKMRQKIRHAVLEETITIYNGIKKIDFEVALLNWEGVLYREFRMAMPLNMENAQVAYEVPYGVSEVGKDEIHGAAGERYLTPAADIHPRGIENWIGASNDEFGVTLSSSVAVADYIDPTDKPVDYTVLQPILLASRKSCHWVGNEYLQTGNHYFSFSLTSHQPGCENGFRFGKQANEHLVTVVNPQQYVNASLPEIHSFFNIDADNVIVSAIKKCDDDNAIIIRLYDVVGQNSSFDIGVDRSYTITKVSQTSLIEEEILELPHSENIIPFNLKRYSIETLKIFK